MSRRSGYGMDPFGDPFTRMDAMMNSMSAQMNSMFNDPFFGHGMGFVRPSMSMDAGHPTLQTHQVPRASTSAMNSPFLFLLFTTLFFVILISALVHSCLCAAAWAQL